MLDLSEGLSTPMLLTCSYNTWATCSYEYLNYMLLEYWTTCSYECLDYMLLSKADGVYYNPEILFVVSS